MNRKMLWGICSLLMLLPFFVACDDEKNNEPDQATLSSISMNYSIKLHQNWFDYHTVKVEYVDAEGVEQSIVIDRDWSYTATVEPDNAVDTYYCHIVALPKENTPTIEPDQRYEYTCDSRASLEEHYSDGSKVSPTNSVSNQNHTTLAGNKMQEWMSKEHNLLQFTCKRNR